MKIIKIIKNRIYNDFLMPSRLLEYENIIKKSLENGYEHITLKDYVLKLRGVGFDKKRYFIHRHDIDTDVRTARKFFEIEKKYNVKTTYYFRLSTLDFHLMKEINDFGSEASYHFEEIAQYCKDKHIKSKAELLKEIEEVKKIFIDNVQYVEKGMNYRIYTVASHGDFVNRKLKITNNELTNDMKLRDNLNILAESYDKDLINSFDIYISDKQYPIFYAPKNIFDVIGNENVICMLSHPRQWETNVMVNLFDNLKRVWEGLRW